MATAYMEQHATQERMADGATIIAGAWLVLAPFALNYSANGGSTANDITAGIAVLALAAWQMFGENVKASWPNWTAGVLGAWLIASPFIYGFSTGSNAMWNDIVLGVIVASVAVVGGMLVPKDDGMTHL
jgi:SPW repeat